VVVMAAALGCGAWRAPGRSIFAALMTVIFLKSPVQILRQAWVNTVTALTG
jgi:hypothetical protein